MRNNKKRTIMLLLLITLFITQWSCNNWLDIMPQNEQVTDRFWENKEEVKGVLMSSYKQLRACVEKMVLWGELRADVLEYQKTGDALKIKELDIISSNSVCKWGDFYTAISRANSVIKYGPDVLIKDPSFSKEVLNSYVAEAIFIRSLCYFYLVRTFGNVPYITEPYIDDTQEFAVPAMNQEIILKALLADLKANVVKCKTGYENDGLNIWANKGRATKWAYHALMADINLWLGNYSEVINECDQVAKGSSGLVNKDNWFKIFYPGNSSESLFEIQYSKTMDNSTNSIFSWFHNGTSTSTWLLSSKVQEMYEEYAEKDIRGESGTYTKDLRLWKYGGTGFEHLDGSLRSSSQYDNNWVIYRYADVLLMKAEAYVMMGQMDLAYELIVNEIRIRAGYTFQIEKPEDELAGINMVMNERIREFVGEGKRWFDILRVAKRNNYQHKEYLLTVLLEDIPAKDYDVWNSKLQDPNSWFLPIHKLEIENGKGILLQNPYYAEND